jgi:hypothetical protein
MTDKPHDNEPPRIEQPPPETRSRQQNTETLGDRATDRMSLRPSPEFQQHLDDFKAEKAARQEAAVEDLPSSDARVDAPADSDAPANSAAVPEARPATAPDVPVTDAGPRGDRPWDDGGTPPDGDDGRGGDDGGEDGPTPPNGGGGDNGDDGNGRPPPEIDDVIAGLEPPDTRGTQRYHDAREASDRPLIDDNQFEASLFGNLDVDTLSDAGKDTYRDIADRLGQMDAISKADAILTKAKVDVYGAANDILQHADINGLQAIAESLSDAKVSPSDVATVSLVALKYHIERLDGRGTG